ncbi:MAG TPA: PPC domain-containing protein, partial [Pirellulales bacterium]|nr:PPC domain-containing protein [Pirellulales bacterium]
MTILAALALAAIGPASARAQSSYPMLMSLKPIGVQIGATTEHEVSARYNLYGASQVIVAGSGVTGEVVPPEMPPAPKPEAKPGETASPQPPKKPEMPKIKLRFTVAADAVPGPRSFRVITPQGASTVGQLVLVRDPVIYETDKNDTLAGAQAVTLPATLCGAIEKAEDVDIFKFTVAANQAITFHVLSQRCENKIHDLQVHSDPILTLRNSSGTVLALNDNYFYGDPLLNYRFTAAGEYTLEIRDARYQGNVEWQYCIEAHDHPFVTNIVPSRLTPGVATRVNLVGFNLPSDPTALVTLPPDVAEDVEWINVPLAGGATVAAPAIVSRLPEFVESASDNDLIAQAQPITVPAGVSGVISKEGDIDCYSFDAKKDELISFEVVARRRQSSLDSIFRVLNDKGAAHLEIDDMNTGRHIYADSQLENWKVPADGKYFVEIRDLHQRGGPDFAYFLKVTKSQPYFALDLDSDKTLLAPGAGAAIYVRAYRRNGFAGDIQLAVEGLPPGVTAQCGKILAAATDGCIVLQAAADAPHSASNLKITGTASIPAADANQPPVQLTAVAQPLQETYMPGGGRSHYPV